MCDNRNVPPNQDQAWLENNPSNTYNRIDAGDQLLATLETKDPILEWLALMEEQMKMLLFGKNIDNCDFDEELEPFASHIAATP